MSEKIAGLRKAVEDVRVMAEIADAMKFAAEIDSVMREVFRARGPKQTTLALAFLSGWWGAGAPYPSQDVIDDVVNIFGAGVKLSRGEADELRLSPDSKVAIRLPDEWGARDE